jgi:hypothetical protein
MYRPGLTIYITLGIRMHHTIGLLRTLGIVVLAGMSFAAAFAQSDQQQAQNLATCLSGRYPVLCKHQWLSTGERSKVDQAERRENLRTCLTGRYPNLCNKQRLSPEEGQQVTEAERRENLRTCMTGRYANLCKKTLLTDFERTQVLAVERNENLRTCSTGRYPVLCNRSMLTPEQLTQVQAAEARVRSSKPIGTSPSRGSSRGRSYSLGCEDGHWVDSVSDDGTIVKLDDGSVWEVDSVDAIDSALWLPTTDIIACDDKLINTDDNEKVSARRLR